MWSKGSAVRALPTARKGHLAHPRRRSQMINLCACSTCVCSAAIPPPDSICASRTVASALSTATEFTSDCLQRSERNAVRAPRLRGRVLIPGSEALVSARALCRRLLLSIERALAAKVGQGTNSPFGPVRPTMNRISFGENLLQAACHSTHLRSCSHVGGKQELKSANSSLCKPSAHR